MHYLITTGCSIAVAASLCLGGPADQRGKQAPANPSGSQVSGADSADRDTEALPTAEELLKALQRQRPVNEVIPPASSAENGGQPAQRMLWPEGSAVVSRPGWLVEDGLWWRFVFDPPDGEPPTRLLPNAGLEVMIRTATGSQLPVKYVVSGEMTVFGDENYLLIRVVRRSTGTSRQTVRPEGIESGTGSTKEQTVGPEQERSSATRAGDVLSVDPPVEDVLAALKQQEPGEDMMEPLELRGEDRLDSYATAARRLIPDGSALVQRPGRVVHEGQWWTLVFESDHPDHPEPPMKLLPNKSVEMMLEASKRQAGGLVFLVSGEVAVFWGENFLLPRVAMLRADPGNLRR